MTELRAMLEHLDDALRAVCVWLDEESIPGAIVGGVAVSLLGRPRTTRDVDAVIIADGISWERAFDSATRHELLPRNRDPLEFARRSRMMLLVHAPTRINVDVSLGALPFERDMVERRQVLEVGGLRIPVITAEDLLVMKALARRPRDLGDIETVLDANPDVDLDHVRRWLREFSSALDMPDIHEEFESLLRRRR